MSSQKILTTTTTTYSHTSPPRAKLDSKTKIFNIHLSLEEALKLNLGIDEAIRKIVKYKESSVDGKRATVHLGIHLDKARISIAEGKLPKK